MRAGVDANRRAAEIPTRFPPISATLVTDDLGPGGAEKVLSLMANYWAAKGWRITFMTLENGSKPHFWRLDPSVRYMDFDWSKVYRAGIPKIRLLCTLAALRSAIGRTKPDIVISFLHANNVAVLMATYRSGVPVIVSERSDPRYDRIPPKWERLRRLFYPSAACLVTQTQAALDYFPHAVRNRGCVIPNPVALPEGFEPHVKTGRPRKSIIGVGRLVPVKGFDRLIEAFARLAAANPNWLLTIWGEGPERPRLERLVRDLGLQKRVSLPGAAQSIHSKLLEADIFVLSSHHEGFPNSLCEAMACGLPVIGFDCPSGPRAIMRDGIDGILVQPGDIDALSRAIQRLIDDPTFRSHLSENAPLVLERFGMNRVMSEWERLIHAHL